MGWIGDEREEDGAGGTSTESQKRIGRDGNAKLFLKFPIVCSLVVQLSCYEIVYIRPPALL